MRKLLLLACILPQLSILLCQNLNGEWIGVIYQEETQDTFNYQLTLTQEGDQFAGSSKSSTLDGSVDASFNVTGVLDSNKLVIQEISQISPKSPKWCLKYLILEFKIMNGQAALVGNWTAKGCVPGKAILTNPAFQAQSYSTETTTQELPFSMSGSWTGYLNQSDRDYGFYFEVQINDDHTGTSYIVSEDNGGSAYHHFDWSYGADEQSIQIKEAFVKTKSDNRWPWCIKALELSLAKEKHTYNLKGRWKGYIEGYTLKTGSCAPGNIFLEKPIETVTTSKVVANPITSTSSPPDPPVSPSKLPYENEKKRKVKVQRVIEVQSPDLRIKVWDNGTVDGDVVTVFLNGELLFEKYRVTKHKYSKIVKLQAADNYLILHAEDLGKISPNTVAVSIDDGVKEQIIILSSNLDESGAIMIKQFKLE